MRGFFTKVNSLRGFFEDNNADAISTSSTSTPSRPPRPSPMKSKSSSEKSRDNVQTLLLTSAAQCLTDTVQEILSDTANLTGESISGFVRLIDVIVTDVSLSDITSVLSSNGMGCMNVLLGNISHPRFIEICNQCGLAIALMHALRLIRMFEIKQNKLDQQTNLKTASLESSSPTQTKKIRFFSEPTNLDSTLQIDYGGANRSLSFDASFRVCKVFETLCTNSSTVEQIRQSLVKLFTFPLSVVPVSAIHVQHHSAAIVSTLCRTAGFTSQQVWFLHDVQAISHMVGHLKELALNPDCGDAGMWIIGIRCIVDVLTASVTVSSVLMGDFESADGTQLFIQLLRGSTPEHFMRGINIITRLLFDPHRLLDVSVPFPVIGALLSKTLTTSLLLKRCISTGDSIENMIEIGNTLATQSREIADNDYIIQGLAYAMLTMYSNDPQNCSALEDIHHILPTLLISLPSLTTIDAISAVLTTINYVCQCVENAALLPLTALCAASAIMVNRVNNSRLPAEARKFSIDKFELTVSSYEAVIRSSGSYAMVLLRNGMLKHIFLGPFQFLDQLLASDQHFDEYMISIFDKIISLILSMSARSPYVSTEMRKSGINSLLRRIIELKNVPSAFCENLLQIFDAFCKRDTVHLIDGLDFVFGLLESTIGDYGKQKALMDCLSNILIANEDAANLCMKKGVMGKSLYSLNLIAIKFHASLVDLQANRNVLEEMVGCLESLFRLLSIVIFQTLPTTNDNDFENTSKIYRTYWAQIAFGLLTSSIFTSVYKPSALGLIRGLLNCFSPHNRDRIVNADAIEVLTLLIPYLDTQSAHDILKVIKEFASKDSLNIRILSEAKLVSYLVEILYCLPSQSSELGLSIVDLVQLISFEYLTVEGFQSLVLFVARPAIVNKLNFKLLMPWQAYETAESLHSWTNLSFLTDLAAAASSSSESAPFVSLENSGSQNVSNQKLSYIQMSFSESGKGFPSFGFSASLWFKVEGLKQGILPLLTLAIVTNNSSKHILEVQFDPENFFFRVITWKSGTASSFRFKPAAELDSSNWNSFIFSFRRPKRFTGVTKSTFSLYLNGLLSPAVSADCSDMDFPSAQQIVQIYLGKAALTYKPYLTESIVEDAPLLEEIRAVDKWCLGPFYLFEEALTQEQVSFIFIKGPQYTGLFQAESPESDYLPTWSAQLLRRCCTMSQTSLEAYFDELGLRGMETVVEPKIEVVVNAMSSLSIARLPQVLVCLNATNVRKGNVTNNNETKIGSSNFEKSEFSGAVILNAVPIDSNAPISSLMGQSYASNGLSFANCVAALGGPSILFPLLQSSSTPQQLCHVLSILKSAIQKNAKNLRYMQYNGYKMLAFILSLKPSKILDESVLAHVFGLSICSCVKNGIAYNLLADTSVFHYVFLNHSIWDAARYSVMKATLRHVKSLAIDEKFDGLNLKRLSLMGVSRYLLQLSVHGVMQISDSTDTDDYRIQVDDKWTFNSADGIELSENRDEPDAFLKDCMDTIQKVMSAEIRKKDLDLILKIIMYSFISRYNKHDSSTSTASGSMDVDTSAQYPFCNYDDSDHIDPINVLTPLAMLRVYLFRLLFSLYDDHSEYLKFLTKSSPQRRFHNRTDSQNAMHLFRNLFNPEWFFGVIEKAFDIATRTHCLRLLGLFLQKDALFQRDFCNADGFHILIANLSNQPQDIPILLPLLAIFFRIPMQLLMHPFQIKSISRFVQILELDECLGPVLSETEMIEMSIPLLSLLCDCFINAVRGKEKRTMPLDLAADLLISIFHYAIEKKHSFKFLMQHKYAVEIFCVGILGCSDAYSDFGSHIFVEIEDRDLVDLSNIIHEDYIAETGNVTMDVGDSDTTNTELSSQPNTRTIEVADYQEQVSDIKMSGSEGLKLLDILQNMILQSITEFDNSFMLFNLFSSFPQTFMSSYEFGFQKIIFEKFSAAVEVLLGHVSYLYDEYSETATKVINNIVNVIPLIRSNLLDEFVIFELFKLCLDLLMKACNVQNNANSVLHERVQKLIKEIGSTARFFSVTCLSLACSQVVAKNQYKPSKIIVLSMIRLHLTELMHSLLEDSVEISPSSMGNRFIARRDSSSTDDVTSGNIHSGSYVYEGIGGLKRAYPSSLMNNRSERNRVALAFCMYLLTNSYYLVLDDDSAVRNNAIKVIAFLAINRRAQLEQLLGNAPIANNRIWKNADQMEESVKEVDIFRDGISKLVPNASGFYELFIRGGTDDNDSEENRFADFMFWMSNNNSKCDKIIGGIEKQLSMISPSIHEVDEIVRFIATIRLRSGGSIRLPSHVTNNLAVNDGNMQAARVMSSMERAEEGQRLGEQVAVSLKRWNVAGLMFLSSGAIHWRNAWAALQCGNLWGYKGIESILMDNKQFKDLLLIKDDLNRSEESIEWSVDPAEGPERMRKLLEQNLAVSTVLLMSEIDDFKSQLKTSNKVIEKQSKTDANSFFISPKSSFSISSNVASPSPEFNFRASISSPSTSLASNAAAVKSSQKVQKSISIDPNPLSDSEQTADTMEHFMRRLSLKGLIKRMDIFSNLMVVDNDKVEDFDPVPVEVTEPIGNDSLLGGVSAADNEDEANGEFVGKETRERFLSIDASQDFSILDSEPILSQQDIFDEDKVEPGSTPSKLLVKFPSTDAEDYPTTYHLASSADSVKSYTVDRTDPSLERLSTNKSMILQEIVKGIIGASEWTQGKVYNVKRIFGLEAQSSLLVVTEKNIHVINGFILKSIRKSGERTLDWVSSFEDNKIMKADTASYCGVDSNMNINRKWLHMIWCELLCSDIGYCKISLDLIYTIFKRRHELKSTALEITEVNGFCILVSCDSVAESEELLFRLLERNLPSSIFNRAILKNIQIVRGTAHSYKRMISMFISSVTSKWQHGELSNFEYLMHINAAAGRSFQDLTQYPVFPWVIADYTSEKLDLNDPKTFRDLSKPMGAIGTKRAKQCRDRYQTMRDFYGDGIDGSSPPFFYGTHYSCAGYVLHYLMRLQPYTSMAMALQGGCFDKADRLFLSIENSWMSASRENLQDVRELIPEFYYLPDFLVNGNNLDLGVTQKDEVVNNVALPRWANNDPHEFIRLHRAALESKYVSEHLHHWIDLIFGYKQQGKEAIDAMNVFIHLTYEGEVDVDAITDPVMKNATISQINNFGQTPSMLFSKPHVRKIVPDIAKVSSLLSMSSGLGTDLPNSGSIVSIGNSSAASAHVLIDANALHWHGNLCPPLSVVGAPQYEILAKISYTQVTFPGNLKGLPVGDIRLQAGSRDRLLTVPARCILMPSAKKKFVRFGGPCGSISFQPFFRSAETEASTHENLHSKAVTCVAVNKIGDLIATGSEDSSIRVWTIVYGDNQRRKLKHVCTFVGHFGPVLCMEISSEFSMLVSGGADRSVMVWNYRTKRMLYSLSRHNGPVFSLSVNSISGQIFTLTSNQLRVYGINGRLLSIVNIDVHESSSSSYDSFSSNSSSGWANSSTSISAASSARVVVATPMAEWQEGVVAVTGHEGGHVYLWRLRSLSVPRAVSFAELYPKDFDAAHYNRESLSWTKQRVSAVQEKDDRAEKELLLEGVPMLTSQLYISSTLTKVHTTDITVMRLCSTGAANRTKDLVTKSFDDNRTAVDLLVGDADGFVSRWAPLRLDQLPNSDLHSIIMDNS